MVSGKTETSSQFFPQAWNGSRSDTAFTSTHEDGVWILGIRIEAETPVVLQSPHTSPDLMAHHADMMDLGLAIARDPAAWPDADIISNALGLAYCRDFYLQNGQMIHSQIAEARPQMEVSRDNMRRMQSNVRSAEAMCRISNRINAALARALDPNALERLNAPIRGRRN